MRSKKPSVPSKGPGRIMAKTPGQRSGPRYLEKSIPWQYKCSDMWPEMSNFKVRSSAGIFVLRHRLVRCLYWGISWDLRAMRKDYMHFVADDARFKSARCEEIDFIVIKYLSRSATFQPFELDASLEAELHSERQKYRLKSLVHLLKWHQLAYAREAIRLWHHQAACIAGMGRAADSCNLYPTLQSSNHPSTSTSTGHILSSLKPARAKAQDSDLKPVLRPPWHRALATLKQLQGHLYMEDTRNSDRKLAKPTLSPCYAPHAFLTSHRQPFLGYASHQLYESQQRHLLTPLALTIQRYWRGHRARTIVRGIAGQLRVRSARQHRAACCVQAWFRGCLRILTARQERVELGFIASNRIILQRVWRGHHDRRRFHQQFDPIRALRLEGAIAAQRITRGFLGRQTARYMRAKIRRFRMSGIATVAFLRFKAILQSVRGLIHAHKTIAAKNIQKEVRRWLAKRILARLKAHQKQDCAASRIQLCYHRCKYRRAVCIRLVLQRWDNCSLCDFAKAMTYLDYTAQKLCQRCYHRSCAVLYEKSIENASRSVPIEIHRQESQAARAIQKAYLENSVFKLSTLGTCSLCEKRPRRVYCFHCRSRSCHTCSAAVHSMRLLMGHRRQRYEEYKRQKRAAEVIVQFFSTYRTTMKIYARFRDDYVCCASHAALLLQSLWRGYAIRQMYGWLRHCACGLIAQMEQQRRVYPLWAAYRILILRVPRMLAPRCYHWPAHARHFGFGLLDRIGRRKVAQVIEKGLLQRHAYYRSCRRRDYLECQATKAAAELHSTITKRIHAAAAIQGASRRWRAKRLLRQAKELRQSAAELVHTICDVSKLWRRAVRQWKRTRGFIGQFSFSAFHIVQALCQTDPLPFHLQPSGPPEAPGQDLVGGVVTLQFSLRSVTPSALYRVTELHSRGTRELGPQLCCVHATQASLISQGSAPHVLSIQLVGLGTPSKALTEDTLTLMRGCHARIFVCGQGVYSSSRPLPCKLQPGYYDETYYADFVDAHPVSGQSILKADIVQRPNQACLGVLKLNAQQLLQSLGRTCCFPLISSRETPTDVCLALLLSIEDAKQTEAREAVACIMQTVLASVRTQLDDRSPRTEMTIGPLRLLDGFPVQGSLYSRIKWNGCIIEPLLLLRETDAVAQTVRLEIPNGYPEDQLRARLLIYLITEGPPVIIGKARLSHRQLYQPEGVSFWIPFLGLHGPGRPLFCVRLHLLSRATPEPRWWTRRNAISAYVPRLISVAVHRVPQPRIEVRVLQLLDLVTDLQDLTVTIYWGGQRRASFRESQRTITKPPSSLLECERIAVEFRPVSGPAFCFFPAAHTWNHTPDFCMIVHGHQADSERPIELAQARLERDDILLLHRVQPTELTIVRDPPQARYNVLQQVSGRLITQFATGDIPSSIYSELRPPQARLCLALKDLRCLLPPRERATYMQKLRCCIFWKGSEVAISQESSQAQPLTWPSETYTIPITCIADHPVLAPGHVLPLMIQLLCRPRGGADVLLGNVQPFSGTARSLPCLYQLFDIQRHASSAPPYDRWPKILGQLGLGIWIDAVETDERKVALIAQNQLDESASEPTIDSELQSEIQLGKASRNTMEMRQKMTKVEAMDRTRAAAKDIWEKAQRAAGGAPQDRKQKHFTKLLEKEHNRAQRAARMAQLEAERSQELAADTNPSDGPSSDARGMRRPHAKTLRKVFKTVMNFEETVCSTPQSSSIDVPAGMSGTNGKPTVESTEPICSSEEHAQIKAAALTESALSSTEAQESTLSAPKVVLHDWMGNRLLCPGAPVPYASAFVRFVGAKNVTSHNPLTLLTGTNVCARILWGGQHVGTSGPATNIANANHSYQWAEETYLLPFSLPASARDSELQVEVYVGSSFAGEIALDHSLLAGLCLDPSETESPTVSWLQLMPKDGSRQVNTFGKLGLYAIRLQPQLYRSIRQEVRSLIVDAAQKMLALGGLSSQAVDTALLDKVDNLEHPSLLLPGHLDLIEQTYAMRRILCRLFILSGRYLYSGTLPSSTFLIVCWKGSTLGQTKPTSECANPLFRQAIFDVPLQAFSLKNPSAGQESLLVQIWVANKTGASELRGHITLTAPILRDLLLSGKSKSMSIEPETDLTDPSTFTDPTSPVLEMAVSLLTRPPGQSGIEMRVLGLHDLTDMPVFGSKAVLCTVIWNGQHLGQLGLKVAPSGALTGNPQPTILLPFGHEQPVSTCSSRDQPGQLLLDFYDQKGTRDQPIKGEFLGTISTCGSLGIPVKDEAEAAASRIGQAGEEDGTRFAFSPKTDLPTQTVSGFALLNFCMIDPSESAHTWLHSTKKALSMGPSIDVGLSGALNLPHVGAKPCNALAVLYWNQMELYRTEVIKETPFPIWRKHMVRLPLSALLSPSEDQATALRAEVYHDAVASSTYLGHAIIHSMVAEALQTHTQLRHDLPLMKRGYGSSQGSAVQGSLSVILSRSEQIELIPPAEDMDITSRVPDHASEQEGEGQEKVEMQHWISLNVYKAHGLRQTDLLGKSDPYCLLFWHRRERFSTFTAWESIEPVWNQSFRLNYDPSEEEECGDELELRILVFDKEAVGPDNFLGQAVLHGPELLKGNGACVSCALQKRPDVPADADLEFSGTLEVSYSAERQLPYRQALAAMNLQVGMEYVALDVVQLHLQGQTTSRADGKPRDNMSEQFFVKLLHQGHEVAEVTSEYVLEGEVRFKPQTCILPLSSSHYHDPQKEEAVARAYDLQQSDLHLQVFSSSAHHTSRNLGYVKLSLSDFTTAPAYQCRRALIKGILGGIQARNQIVIRLAHVSTDPSPAPALTCSPEAQMRLRLRVHGVMTDERSAAIEGDSARNHCTDPESVIHFSLRCVSDAAYSTEGEVPWLNGDMTVPGELRHPKEATTSRQSSKEYLLPLSVLRTEQQTKMHLLMHFRTAMGADLGQLCWDCYALRRIAQQYRTFHLSILEASHNTEKPMPIMVSPIMYLCTTSPTGFFALKITHLTLFYSMRLELLTPSEQIGGVPARPATAPHSSATKQYALSHQHNICAHTHPQKHVTSQGFPCLPTRSNGSCTCPKLQGSLRRLRLTVLQVLRCRHSLHAGTRLVPAAAFCRVFRLSRLEAQLDVPRTRVCDMDIAASTAFIEIPTDTLTTKDEQTFVVLEASTTQDNAVRGIITLSLPQLLSLPLYRNQYNIQTRNLADLTTSTSLSCDYEMQAQHSPQPLRAPPYTQKAIIELSRYVVTLQLCLEESIPSLPYVIELRPKAVSTVASYSEFGRTRIPGKKQRELYLLTRHNNRDWHTSRLIQYCGQGLQSMQHTLSPHFVPIEDSHEDINVQMQLFDLSFYTKTEVQKVCRAQRVARKFLACNKVARLRAQRQQADRQWRAATIIFTAVQGWIEKRLRQLAARQIQRLLRGALERIRFRRMLQTSYVKVELLGLHYVALQDDSVSNDITPMHVTISWKQKVIKEYKLPVKPYADSLGSLTLQLPLKKVVGGEQELLVVHQGTEYYLVEDATLAVTISKAASAFDFWSKYLHVARLDLAPEDLAELRRGPMTGISEAAQHKQLPTCFSLYFRRVKEGDKAAFDTRVPNASALREGNEKERQKQLVSKSSPNLLLLVISVVSAKPLWPVQRSLTVAPDTLLISYDGTIETETFVDARLCAAEALNVSIDECLRLVSIKPMWLRISHARVPPGVNIERNTDSLQLLLVLVWVGRPLQSYRLGAVEARRTGWSTAEYMWEPLEGEKGSTSKVIEEGHTSQDINWLPHSVELAPATSRWLNPELTCALYSISPEQDRKLLATRTLSVSDMQDLSKDRMDRHGRYGSDEDSIEVRLDELRHDSGEPISPATNRQGRALSATSRAIQRHRTEAPVTSIKASENSSTSVAIAVYDSQPFQPAQGDMSAWENSPPKTPKSGGPVAATPPRPLATSNTPRNGIMCEYDEPRQLWYYRNERGNRVFKFAKEKEERE